MSDATNTSFKWSVAFCSALMFASLTVPLLTGRIFVFNDLTGFHLPMRYLYQQALRAGDSLLWTPAVFSGFYIHGEGQIGLFHPLHLLFYAPLPLFVGFNLELLANYAGAFAGTNWLLRRLKLDAAAALLGSMLFAFSGFNLLHHHHLNVIAVVAHIPWLLACADVVLTAEERRHRALGYAGLVLVFASEQLLGFPQGVWWNSIALAGFTVFRASQTATWHRLVPCALAIGTGGLIGAIQLLPTLETGARSFRPLVPRDFSLSYSLHPINVLQFWSPYVLANRVFDPVDHPWAHELGIYAGAVGMVSLPWLWIRRRALGTRRPLVGACLVFAAVTFVLALGRHGGLDVLLTYLPVLGSFRAPVRYIVLTQFSLAILTAIAFEDLAADREPPTRRDVLVLCIPAALNVVTTLALNAHMLPIGSAYPFSSPARAGVGTLLMLITTLAFVLAAGRVKWALAAVVVVAMVDVGIWGLWPIFRERPRTIASLTATVPPPPDNPGESYAYVDPDPALSGDVLLLTGYRMTGGYVALFPSVYYPVTSPEGQQLAGARWRFSVGAWKVPMPGPVDRARMLSRVRVSDDLRRDVHDVDLHETALLEHPIPALTGPPGTARVLVDRPGHIVVETSAPGRQLLALTEREHPGWSATAEGRLLEMVKVHGDFLGCVVEAGTHRVEFRFMPRSFVNGAVVSAIGLLLLPIGFVAMRRSRIGD